MTRCINYLKFIGLYCICYTSSKLGFYSQAVGLETCKSFQEETVSDQEGQYRLRGLQASIKNTCAKSSSFVHIMFNVKTGFKKALRSVVFHFLYSVLAQPIRGHLQCFQPIRSKTKKQLWLSFRTSCVSPRLAPVSRAYRSRVDSRCRWLHVFPCLPFTCSLALPLVACFPALIVHM